MSVHKGHRERLDKKLLEKGIDTLEKHEILEQLLFAVIPRGNTNEIAHKLLEQFTTLSGVFNAETDELTEVEGVGYRTAVFLKSLPQLLGEVERGLFREKHVNLEYFDDRVKYIKSFFHGKLIESAYVITVNSAYGLINHHKISEGVANQTHIYKTLVAKLALDDYASGVILVHNHPSGDLIPSVSDVKNSREVEKVLKPLGIELLDSIIIACGEGFSLIENDYLKEFDF